MRRREELLSSHWISHWFVEGSRKVPGPKRTVGSEGGGGGGGGAAQYDCLAVAWHVLSASARRCIESARRVTGVSAFHGCKTVLGVVDSSGL